jgi:hypothetical protein
MRRALLFVGLGVVGIGLSYLILVGAPGPRRAPEQPGPAVHMDGEAAPPRVDGTATSFAWVETKRVSSAEGRTSDGRPRGRIRPVHRTVVRRACSRSTGRRRWR